MAGKKLKPLRVGVIGCGRISPLHLSAAAEAPEAKLVACCDIDKKKAKAAARKYHIRAFRNFRRMIRWKRLNAVHICLPHHLHTVVADYCLTKKVHVLSEKPMAIDLPSAERTVRFAEINERQYGVIFQCRYNATSQLVKRALTSGRLGRILSVRSVLTWNRPAEYYSESNWKGTWDKEGGGVLIDQAIHTLDLVNWLVDSEVDSISCAMANRNHPTLAVEDSAEGFVLYKSGVRYGFYFMNNYESDAPIEIRLVCENGEVTFGYDEATITYRDGTVETAHEGEMVSDKDHIYWGTRHACQIRQFYRACRGQEELEISGKAALPTHRLLFSLYEAARKRGIDYTAKGAPAPAPVEEGKGIKIRYY